jgi:hypothetical protein
MEDKPQAGKSKKPMSALIISALLLIVTTLMYWESHKANAHQNQVDRPYLRPSAGKARPTAKGDKQHFMVWMDVKNVGHLEGTITETSSKPLSGVADEGGPNQMCYQDMRNQAPLRDPNIGVLGKIAREGTGHIGFGMVLPPTCSNIGRHFGVDVTFTYQDESNNVYHQTEDVPVSVEPD